jgi:hypothetical protein
MKYLKTFEELNPETYMSAADKLSAMGQERRAEELRKYVDSRFFKEFINRQETDPQFKATVEKFKKTPEYDNFCKVAKENPDDIITLVENFDKVKAELEHDHVTFAEFSPEKKKKKIMTALKHIGIGVLAATAVAAIGAVESGLGTGGALHAMVGAFFASLLGFGTMQISTALAPEKK